MKEGRDIYGPECEQTGQAEIKCPMGGLVEHASYKIHTVERVQMLYSLFSCLDV